MGQEDAEVIADKRVDNQPVNVSFVADNERSGGKLEAAGPIANDAVNLALLQKGPDLITQLALQFFSH
jgi:hypothetical protein